MSDGDRPGDDCRDVEDEQLRDVSHEAPNGPGANRVWERGAEDEERE